jgi:hypothetical protein
MEPKVMQEIFLKKIVWVWWLNGGWNGRRGRMRRVGPIGPIGPIGRMGRMAEAGQKGRLKDEGRKGRKGRKDEKDGRNGGLRLRVSVRLRLGVSAREEWDGGREGCAELKIGQ